MFDELSLNILDIGMNSLAAGARRIEVSVVDSARRNWLVIRVRDDGRGMDAATLKRILSRNASTKTTRKKSIGLGLALLRQTAEMCGGRFQIRSAPGKGTSVTVSMRHAHVDRPPLGDLVATIHALAANPAVDVRLHYRSDEGTFEFSSQEGKHHEPRRTQTPEGESATAGCAA